MRHWVCLSCCFQKNSYGHHHQRIAKPHQLKLEGVGGGGGTNLQKPLHCLSRSRATCGSTAPTSSNCSSNLEAFSRLCAKKLGTKDYISNLSSKNLKIRNTIDFFIRGENELRSPKPNNSHFPALIKRSSGGPSSWMIENTLA